MTPFIRRCSFVSRLGLMLMGLSLSNGARGAEPDARFANDPGFVEKSCVLRDGAKLAYYVRPGDPMLVLIPGTGGTAEPLLTSGLVKALDPKFGITIIELRGCGHSRPPPTPEQANMEQYGSDILAVIAQESFPRWYIGGHSLGGMLCWEVADRRPRGLIGIFPSEGWVHFSVEDQAFQEDKVRNTNKDSSGRNVGRTPAVGYTAEQQAAQSSIWRRWNSGQRIVAEIKYPVLALWGDRNLSPRPQRQLLLLPDNPNIELHWIPGAEHRTMITPKNAPVLGRAINAFVERTAPKP